MYHKYYLEASKAADRIREGKYEAPKREGGSGFVSPKVEEDTPQQNTYMDMIATYMDSLRSTPISYGDDVFDNNMYNPVQTDLERAKASLAVTESGGNYKAVGPSVNGKRAYGKYQVMDYNIGPWTREALGRSYTVSEFLASPAAQEAVVDAQLMRSYNKYGTWEDAASVWFSGGPLAKNKHKSDGYLTTEQYVSKFVNNLKKG